MKMTLYFLKDLYTVPVLLHEDDMDSETHPSCEDRMLHPTGYLCSDVGFYGTEAAVKNKRISKSVSNNCHF